VAAVSGGRLEIRPATMADEGALRDLDRETWSPLVNPGPRPAPAAPLFDERVRPRDVLLATVGGDLAGSIVFGPPLPLASNRHQLHIKGLAVDPGHRRQGIGAALVEALAGRARGAGVRRLTLRVLATNVPARALYEHLGFEVEGVLREAFLLEGDYVDDLLLGLDLTGPAPAP
jgi:ribosomal protein S18 acetylase RimI-like enzyme